MKNNKINFKKLFLIIISVSVCFACCNLLYMHTSIFENLFIKADSDKLLVHFIDVGKADAIFIQNGENEILIDAGNVSSKNIVNNYIKRLNVNDIDLVVATHPDSDHIGDMPDVIDEFDIDKFILSASPVSQTADSYLYNSMLSKLQEKDVPIIYAKASEQLNIGEIKINILGPVKQYEDTNSNSVVLQLVFRNKKFLFTGDATEESEKDIIKSAVDLKSDVLKLGHHGSKTSTSIDFLNAVCPEFAVISVGKDKNNLPNQQILDRLNSRNIKTYRTDINGNILIQTDGNTITVKTEKS